MTFVTKYSTFKSKAFHVIEVGRESPALNGKVCRMECKQGLVQERRCSLATVQAPEEMFSPHWPGRKSRTTWKTNGRKFCTIVPRIETYLSYGEVIKTNKRQKSEML